MRRFLIRFARETSGAGAVEFALIAPLLFLLYIGGVDVTRAITFSQRLQNATATVNDLVAQSETLSKAEVQRTFEAADAILASYRAPRVGIRVSVLSIDAAGEPKLEWTVVRDMAKPTQAQMRPLVVGLADGKPSTVIVTETAHAFAPLSTYVLKGTIPLSADARGRFRGKKVPQCTDCAS